SSYYLITEEGSYSLSISNMCGQAEDSIEITLLEPPEFSLGPDEQALCEGQVIDQEFDPLLGDFLWQDGSDLNFYSISTAGLYSLTVTNECESISQGIDVYVLPEPVFDLGADTTLCPGQLPILLDIGNIIGAETYLWQDGFMGTQYEVISSGTYSVTVSNECFSVIDNIQVAVVDDSPLVQLPDDQVLCQGQTLTLNANNISGSYLWQDGSTNTEFVIVAAGTYSLTITNDCGSASDTIMVEYISPLAPPDLGPDVSLCPGEEYIFYASTPGVNYTWQNGSTADSLIVNSAGTYWLQIANQCSSASDTVNVVVNSTPPVVDLPSSLSLCDNAFLTIGAGVSGVSYLWSDGSQNPSIVVGSPGAFSITVSNTCGSDVDTVNVIDAGPAPFVDLGNDINICNGDVVTLSPVFSDVNGWLWNDGSTNQSYSVTQAGTIVVEVTNNCGDFADTLIVSLLPDIPPINLGADTSLCPGQSFDLSIDPNGVNIIWSTGSTLPDLQVSSPGLIYATITNECGSASDSVVISQLPPAPSLDLGIDQSLCPGETITISPGITDVVYVWQDGSTGSTFDATQAIDVI
ncbi:MAG: hypothetical protein M3R25_14965, partial [Bacteroidota bacterium]|nr:hypothetical protein [Bacteroidota bacterium]